KRDSTKASRNTGGFISLTYGDHMQRRNRQKKPFVIPPQDMEAAQELLSALTQVEDLPYLDQWQMALSLLPDSFFLYVMRARDRQPDDQMNLYGPLALAAGEALLGEELSIEA